MTVRNDVVDHISRNRSDWHQIILSTYILAQLDRIGHYGSEARQGLPALWGHSYVRTYNAWANTPPPTREFMEGGIATTYYVVKALSHFQRSSGVAWNKSVLTDIAKFFEARIRPNGVGVRGMDGHGIQKIVTHLRHTCYGYLILADLLESAPESVELRSLTSKSAALLIKPLSASELLEELVFESWPVGGIACYIAARDCLYNSPFGKNWPIHERGYWPDVRETMLDALAELSSTHLSVIGTTKEPGQRTLGEHLPYWHPIKDAPILRLHSTLGCLSLVGRDIAGRESGLRRIKEIVRDLREQVMQDPPRTPQFSQTSSPSIAAACAMLKLVLGPWYEPTKDDREFLLYLVDFILLHWKDPYVYDDYWTEFTAPILQIEELTTGFNAPSLIREAEFVIDGCRLRNDVFTPSSYSGSEHESLSALNRIIPTALGLDL